jgi:hypothetical protein
MRLLAYEEAARLYARLFISVAKVNVEPGGSNEVKLPSGARRKP